MKRDEQERMSEAEKYYRHKNWETEVGGWFYIAVLVFGLYLYFRS